MPVEKASMSESNIKEIIKEKQRFEALFNYATIGIVITNQKGNIVLVNRHAETLFGFSREELEGNAVEMLIPTEFKHKHETNRAKYAVHPEVRSMGAGRDLFGQKKNGEKFPIEISLSYFNTEDGLFVIAFVIDITIRKYNEGLLIQQKSELVDIAEEIKQLNSNLELEVQKRTEDLVETLNQLEKSKEELNAAYEREKELGEMKSRFVSMASHEFKTPLSTILSSATLLGKYKAEEDQEKRDKHISRIVNSVNNLTSILNEFLSVGKLEEGNMTVKLEEVDVVDLLEDVCQEMQALAKEGQRLKFTNNSSTRKLQSDKYMLRNVIVNLLSNAIKFSPTNETIEIQIDSDLNQLSIRIEDKGLGISKEDQEHLFQRFFRARNATNIQGTGLGLYIVTKYLELLGGELKMKSELNKGTQFTVVLRIA
jgi:PAS domain S-box-containing protein